jgi:hypothetical protein
VILSTPAFPDRPSDSANDPRRQQRCLVLFEQAPTMILSSTESPYDHHAFGRPWVLEAGTFRTPEQLRAFPDSVNDNHRTQRHNHEQRPRESQTTLSDTRKTPSGLIVAIPPLLRPMPLWKPRQDLGCGTPPVAPSSQSTFHFCSETREWLDEQKEQSDSIRYDNGLENQWLLLPIPRSSAL